MPSAIHIPVASSRAKTMRGLTCGVLVVLAITRVSTSIAADLDYGVLRGPEYEPEVALIDWSGFYIGAHGGYSSAALGFSNTFTPLVAKVLRSTVIENEMTASTLLQPRSKRIEGPSYGAFVGYNIQFDEIVLGVEADYTRFDVAGFTEDRIGRSKIVDENFYQVDLAGRSSTRIIDYGTIRGRAGYAFGSVLPFVTAGLAIGRAKVDDRVSVATLSYNTKDPTAPVTGGRYPDEINKNEKTVAGAALGAGIEYAVTPNILLRGEYQYVLFSDFDGHKVNVNTVRGGAALKF